MLLVCCNLMKPEWDRLPPVYFEFYSVVGPDAILWVVRDAAGLFEPELVVDWGMARLFIFADKPICEEAPTAALKNGFVIDS